MGRHLVEEEKSCLASKVRSSEKAQSYLSTRMIEKVKMSSN